MYAPLRKFVIFKHLVMIGCYKLYIHIQRVQASFAHAEILRFDLTSLACTDMASEHMNRKVKYESYEWYDRHLVVHHWNHVSSHEDRIRCGEFGSCSLNNLRDVEFSGSSSSNLIKLN
jgi:hypothetical protein